MFIFGGKINIDADDKVVLLQAITDGLQGLLPRSISPHEVVQNERKLDMSSIVSGFLPC